MWNMHLDLSFDEVRTFCFPGMLDGLEHSVTGEELPKLLSIILEEHAFPECEDQHERLLFGHFLNLEILDLSDFSQVDLPDGEQEHLDSLMVEEDVHQTRRKLQLVVLCNNVEVVKHKQHLPVV